MDKKKRYLFIVNAIISGMAVIFIAAAVGTEYWIVAYPERLVTDEVKNATDGNGGKFEGEFHAGLFAGEKTLNYGFGPRKTPVEVECSPSENECYYADVDPIDSEPPTEPTLEPAEHIYFSYALWICTILFASLAMAMGVVAIGFSILNASVRPIEQITGPFGLYIWNAVAAGLSLVCIIFYVVLFVEDLSKNILDPNDIPPDDIWTSKNKARLDYSFYFVVVGTVLFLVNICVMALSGVECKRKKSFFATMTTKALDGTMMY